MSLENAFPVIPDRLFFLITDGRPTDSENKYYFSIDNDPAFEYHPFFEDFGPLSIAMIHKFVSVVSQLLQIRKEILVFLASTDSKMLPNSTLLIAAYRMISMGIPPLEALSPFSSFTEKFLPFRDATSVPSTYSLTVLSCLKGLHKAIELGWYDFSSFDSTQWEHDEQVPNGDMNWIIPGKILALASPYKLNTLPGIDIRLCTPRDLIPILHRYKIDHIVRLNKKEYDETIFSRAGFAFTDLFFLDGSCPTSTIVSKWMKIATSNDNIAIHCQAGLGRTGTLIGCYLIQEHHFRADEAIAWIRLCRPGSIIGPQQQYLVKFAQTYTKTTPNLVRKEVKRPPIPGGSSALTSSTPKIIKPKKGESPTPQPRKTKRNPLTPK